MALNKKKSKVLVIVGPTASGKTELSLCLAKRFNGEIISADSRQIYRGMDVGTAKAVTNGRSKAKNSKQHIVNGIMHHLVDIKNPDQDYSAGQFKKDAVKVIGDILKREKLPIIAGGTGLYVSSIVNNLDIPEVRENKELRKQLEKEIAQKGLKSVFDKLVKIDPEAAYIVDPNNSRRIIRAMEIALETGKPFSEQRKKGKPLYEFLQIGINLAPDILRQRIKKRVQQMFDDGLIKEVRILVEKYSANLKALDAIGYREIIQHLGKKKSLDEAEELMIKNTWHYAKRQMTWFNKDKRIKWINDVRKAERLVSGFLQRSHAM